MFSTAALDIRPKANPGAVVQGANYRFTVLTSRLIRMEWSADGIFEDRATKMVLCREFPVPAFTVNETEDALEIVTEHLHLYYDKKRFSQGGLSVGIHGMIKHKCAKWHYHMPDIIVHNGRVNLHGTCSTLDSIDGAIELPDGLLDRHGFVAVEDQNTSVLTEDGWYEPSEARDYVDLYFFGYLENHKDCIRDFYKLSGATPMLPRYALGNWWSRYYKYTEESYKELMTEFAKRKIPLAVSVVDMDWHWVDIDPKYGNGWTGHSWNTDFFPDPERFMTWLHEQGLKVTLNLHPCDGIRAFEDCYEDAAKEMGVDMEKEEPVQFDVADPKFVRVYLDKVLHPLEEQGVDFWWIDWQQRGGFSKDGYDPLWMLNHYLYTDNARKGTYPLTLSRYAGLGSHRYPLGFSGDTVASWESLDFQPFFTNCASNVGYGWWSHDIGGHTRGVWSDELQVRWLQYGVFSPIMRLHSSSNPFMLKEPWNFPMEIEAVFTKWMQLRHALVPYLYTMNYRNHADGVPLCCPLYYEYPQMTNDKQFLNQYTFGSELMVCPITAPMDSASCTGKAHAWIPGGTWFDFFTGRRYEGEKIMDLYRTLDTYPVLAKAGAIIPLADDGYRNGAPIPDAMKVRVFAGADGAFRLYEDDEKLANTRRAVTPMTFTWGETAVFAVAPVEGDASILPRTRTYTLELVGTEKPSLVTVNGESASFCYDAKTATLRVNAASVTADETLTVTVVTSGKLAENDWKAEITARLPRYQIENEEKASIFAMMNKVTTRGAMLSALPALCTNDYVLGELTEIIASAL